MMTGAEVHELVAMLEKREVELYHACQLQDFASYISLGGIPSRNLLTSSGLNYTAFATDHQDKINGVWPRVFVNPEDHASFFEWRHPWVPNPYGPIQIRMHPAVLSDAIDVAWTRRSAGANGFSLESECIDDVKLISALFREPDFRAPDSDRFKHTEELRSMFPDHVAGRPEINCALEGELIPMASWNLVRVDIVERPSGTLRDAVSHLLREYSLGVGVGPRHYVPPRGVVQAELVALVGSGRLTFDAIYGDEALSPGLANYLLSIKEIHWQFDRYARYLSVGTIRLLDSGFPFVASGAN